MPDKYIEILQLFIAGINEVKPTVLIENNILLDGDIMTIINVDETTERVNLSQYKNIYVIGAGKATPLMAKKIEELLGDKISKGVIVTKYGFGQKLKIIKQLEASHPVPDENGIEASKTIIDLCNIATKDDLIINLLSGGASALLPSPEEGISLKEKQTVTDLLLKSGANIDTLNIIRSHISKIKGGGLLKYIYPAKIISFIISDVIGDKLEIIGSGITVYKKKNFKNCFKLMDRYGFQKTFPESVISFCKQEYEKEKTKGEKSIDIDVDCSNYIIGNNYKALGAIKEKAERLGYKVEIVDVEMEGEASIVGRKIAVDAKKFKQTKAKNGQRYCFLYGGETTVSIKGQGKGGRNQELVLAASIELSGTTGITILSGGTDGNDGPTDAAGAVGDGNTVLEGDKIGLSAKEYLERNDSYNFLSKLDRLVITGPSGTNVMDVVIVLINID